MAVIKKVKVENFRSIKSLEIEFRQINAFIGPNNAGKSNILKTLDLVLGESYPTPRIFQDSDFYCHDKRKPIMIEVLFTDKIQVNPEVWGFRLIFDGNNLEYHAINENCEEIKYKGKDLKVSNSMRDKVNFMYLPLNRQANDQIRPSQWTLYGKLLKHLGNEIEKEKKKAFQSKVDEAYKENIYPKVQDIEKTLEDHLKSLAGFDLKLKMSILDPVYIIKNLRPYIKDSELDLDFDCEDVGAGTQSAIAIAIARAYLEFVKKANIDESLILAIEEPELYLHPHGCRHFYKTLTDLARKGVQIIYTTHERSFVNIADFNYIHLVRKEKGETKVYSGSGINFSGMEPIKVISKFDESMNEIFFSEIAILVEGFSDKVACKLALEKLGIDLDLYNISVIECNGKKNIFYVATLARHFGIITFVLIDGDAKKEIEKLKSILDENCIFIQNPNLEKTLGIEKLKNCGLKGEKLGREDCLEILPKYFDNYDAPSLYQELKDKINEKKKVAKEKRDSALKPDF